ncbi:endonuclease/exonuclease/phosphatase family protein [Microvirga puerhi]|uniref:Endonuclease/exonuclease/phosphatase family protein n=1 Tax=Microvirga puerhi TaxID=2876078 RepID=A0ABS7VS21_9HYPH|nr:endonuclease/exonuclease/phosphatase family protein [Microvirga puerhi]MBZ6077865.1 endonuclease/exonuclease/phosphatase family protein [Microvirga puerhi]
MKHVDQPGRNVRVLTYNVHRWLGTDRQISPGRIAEVIASCEADIVALQEVRVGRVHKGHPDQAEILAKHLGMDLHFQPTIRMLGEQYGIAVLTRHPSDIVRAGRLPSLVSGPSFEKRCALWVAVEIDGRRLNVVNAHLSLRSRERRAQAAALLGEEWMGHPDCADPAVLLGDFNAPPYSRSYRFIAGHLRDAQLANQTGDPQPTFHTRAPVLRLDHVFVTPSIEVITAAPVRNALTRVASDHFPLLTEMRVGHRLQAVSDAQTLASEQELL